MVITNELLKKIDKLIRPKNLAITFFEKSTYVIIHITTPQKRMAEQVLSKFENTSVFVKDAPAHIAHVIKNTIVHTYCLRLMPPTIFS